MMEERRGVEVARLLTQTLRPITDSTYCIYKSTGDTQSRNLLHSKYFQAAILDKIALRQSYLHDTRTAEPMEYRSKRQARININQHTRGQRVSSFISSSLIIITPHSTEKIQKEKR